MFRQQTSRPDLRRNPLLPTAALLSILVAVGMGCASTPKPDVVLLESPRAAVYLEPISNRYLEAAHPISLPPETVARVLRGVLVQGRETSLDTLFSSEEKFVRVFSDEDVTLLTPLLVKALSQAKPAQQIRFRLTYPPTGPARLFTMSETGGAAVGSSDMPTYGLKLDSTSATLYVYGLSLYLTVTEYRQKPSRPDDINMPNRRMPDTASVDRVEFLFAPKAALRPESYQESSFFGNPHLTPIVIDYQLLAKLPAPKTPAAQPNSQPTPRPAQPPESERTKAPAALAPSQPPPAPGSSGKQVEAELEALKEELKTIRKQLAEQEAERQKQPAKKKTKPAPVPPQPSP
jgi:hypothetical protein